MEKSKRHRELDLSVLIVRVCLTRPPERLRHAVSLKDTRNLLILALTANRNNLGSLGFARHFNLSHPEACSRGSNQPGHSLLL
jgi:hypothetical protein